MAPPKNEKKQPGDDAPLPPGWSRGFSKSQQKTFYFHAKTKHTQWHFPTASEAADPLKAKRRADRNKKYEKQKSSGSISGGDKGSSGKRNYGEDGEGGLGINIDQLTEMAKQPKNDSSSNGNNKRQKKSSPSPSKVGMSSAASLGDNLLSDTTSVAIIVPYRDIHPEQNRSAHLKQFVPHMVKFFTKLVSRNLVSDYHVYIIEQSNDDRKFNRGKLLNIGFDIARKQNKQSNPPRQPHDVFIFHDVDLLPQDELGVWYSKFPQRPLHIARVWDRYSNNPKYFGGVVSFSSSDYKRINGYPNTFWGWGGEDDEMQKRCERLNIKWESPQNIRSPKDALIDLEQMNLKEKLDFLRTNKVWKCMCKWEALDEHDKTWKTNGIADLTYKKVNETFLDPTEHSTKITVDVKLNPNNHWSNDKCHINYMPPPS